MWREESSGKGQRERLQSRVNGEEWHSLKGLTLHQICMDHKHIKGLTLHRICMDHKHIKGLTLHRICMDHEHIKGFTSRQGHLYHFCLLLVHLGPTFANFCYEVSCHVKNGHKSVPSLLWITSNNQLYTKHIYKILSMIGTWSMCISLFWLCLPRQQYCVQIHYRVIIA